MELVGHSETQWCITLGYPTMLSVTLTVIHFSVAIVHLGW
jgi:hypothetical protein